MVNWKILAIIFMILFGLLLVFNIWSVNSYIQEETKTNECYYDVCNGYIDAWYSDGICYCYETDLLGNEIVTKTEVMK